MLSHLPPKIVIIDDDSISCTALSNTLERSGFSVLYFNSAVAALTALNSLQNNQKPHLIVVDDELQDMPYLQLCKELKDKKAAPIMVLAREINEGELQDNAKMLAGYVLKPVTRAHFIGKIQEVLRTSKPELKAKILSHADIQINLASYKVTRGGREIHLGPTEFKLLHYFMESPSKIFSRQELMSTVLADGKNVAPRTVDVHINRLRAALKNPNDHLPIVRTIRAAGYCLDLADES